MTETNAERAERMIIRFRALDAALVDQGFPATSSWWFETISRFYRTGKRQAVLRVGRRGGKSSTLCRLAVCEAIYGGHWVPRGDTGVVAIISVSRDEAAARLKTIAEILTALRVPHRKVDGTIELTGLPAPVVFRVFTATMAGVVGFTSVFVLCDEVAVWRDAETGANPAAEVLASLRPTMATVPTAKMVLSSSPLGQVDAHFDAFELGDTDAQMVAEAATWIANPTITEDQTRKLEPIDRVWRRSYAAVPQAGTLNCFDPDAVERAFACWPGIPRAARQVLILDPSSGKGDTFSFATAGWVKMAEGRSVLRFDTIDGIAGAFWGQISGEQIVERLAGMAKGRGITVVVADQREDLMLSSAFSKFGLNYKVHAWSATSKPQAVERVRRLLSDNAISIVEHDGMRRELQLFEEKINASGSFTFGARGKNHDDFVALLLTAALADMAGQIPGSPVGHHYPSIVDDQWAFSKRVPRALTTFGGRGPTTFGRESDFFTPPSKRK